MTKTYEAVLSAHAVEIPAHLVPDAEIPLLDGLQRQGDVFVVPRRPGKSTSVEVPPRGIPVVRGEAGGNTHLLVADGPVLWHPASQRGQPLGTLTVPKGSVAYLLHPEHGATGIAPGAYELRRQREMANQIRLVTD